MPDALTRGTPSADEIASVEEALVRAFDLAGLKMMTRHRLGLVLGDEVDLHQGLKYVVHDLVAVAERGGWVDQLVRGARAAVPGNPQLLRAARLLKLEQELPPLPAAADEDRLEKLVRERAPSVSFADFVRRLQDVGGRLCRIEHGAGRAAGTGWLVAADLILTNYHVAKPIHLGQLAAADVVCRFDCFSAASGGGTFEGSTACGLAENWLVDHSVYTQNDTDGTGPEPSVNELDYALLRIERPIAGEPAGGGAPRGWIAVRSSPPAVMAGDVTLVVQHAGGRPLEMAFGTVLAYNTAATRYRHDANTEPGSSGSPSFTVLLEPFGLHHAGGPGAAFKYNQGVPLRRIVAAMAGKQIPPFWSD